jgi:hypothetical protein
MVYAIVESMLLVPIQFAVNAFMCVCVNMWYVIKSESVVPCDNSIG